MDFNQAIQALKEGKKVRKKSWMSGEFAYCNPQQNRILRNNQLDYQITSIDVLISFDDDWELFESSGEFLERLGIDAQGWAHEFINHWGKRKNEIDEALMIGWFANSIEAGYNQAIKIMKERK